MDENKDTKDKPFETASATTDPDNSNSGPFAYILTAACLGATMLLGVIGAGCASAAIGSSLGNLSLGGNSRNGTTPFGTNNNSFPYGNQDDMGLENIDNLLERYEQELYGNSDDEYGSNRDRTNDTGKTTSPADALDFDLAPYGTTINDCVRANAYAGTTAEVRTFVRDFVSKDDDYTKQVVDLLNTAARSEDDQGRMESLKKAITVCDEAIKAFGEVELPEAKDKAEEISYLLTSAKECAQERWMQIKAELELLNSTDDIQTKQLWHVDEDAIDATEDAGDYLVDALEIAAGN